jgi:hypothetical protein
MDINWSTVITILIILGSGMVGYFGSYLSQRVKNKAMIDDNRRLTEEVEKVKTQQILEVERRKLQYEDKRSMFSKYFELVDEIGRKGNEFAMATLPPVMAKFQADLVAAGEDREKVGKALGQFSEYMMKITWLGNQSWLKLKTETNSLKLVSGDDVTRCLDRVESLYEQSFSLNSSLQNAMLQMIIYKDRTEVDRINNEIERLKKELIDSRGSLVSAMKKELNEI